MQPPPAHALSRTSPSLSAEPACPEEDNLGLLDRLPRHLMTENILPQAAQGGFVTGFAGASRAARTLAIEAAQQVVLGHVRQQARAARAALDPHPPPPPSERQPTYFSFDLHRQASAFLASFDASASLYEAQRAQQVGDTFGALWRLAEAKSIWPADARVHRAFVAVAYPLCERYHVTRNDMLLPWRDRPVFSEAELKEAHNWVARFERWDRQLGGVFEGAIHSCEILLSAEPDNVEALMRVGDLMLWQEHDRASREETDPGLALLYEDIAPSFERAIRLRPNSAEAHFRLGRCQKQFGKPAVALAAFERALMYGLGPEQMAQAHLACAEILTLLGRPEAAVREYMFVARRMDLPYRRWALWQLRRLGRHSEEL